MLRLYHVRRAILFRSKILLAIGKRRQGGGLLLLSSPSGPFKKQVMHCIPFDINVPTAVHNVGTSIPKGFLQIVLR